MFLCFRQDTLLAASEEDVGAVRAKTADRSKVWEQAIGRLDQRVADECAALAEPRNVVVAQAASRGIPGERSESLDLLAAVSCKAVDCRRRSRLGPEQQ